MFSVTRAMKASSIIHTGQESESLMNTMQSILLGRHQRVQAPIRGWVLGQFGSKARCYDFIKHVFEKLCSIATV